MPPALGETGSRLAALCRKVRPRIDDEMRVVALSSVRGGATTRIS